MKEHLRSNMCLLFVRLAFVSLSMVFLLVLSGCPSPGDQINLGQIDFGRGLQIVSVKPEGITFKWKKHSDNAQYRIYKTEYTKVDDVVSNGTPLSTWVNYTPTLLVGHTPDNGATYTVLAKNIDSEPSLVYPSITYYKDELKGDGYVFKHLAEVDSTEHLFLDLDISDGSGSSNILFLISNPTNREMVFPQVDLPSSEMTSASRHTTASVQGSLDTVDHERVNLVSGIPAAWDIPRPKLIGRTNLDGSMSANLLSEVDAQPIGDKVEDTQEFFVSNGQGEFAKEKATCRSVVTDGKITLSIWVADNSWHDGGTITNKITQGIVDELAGKFLKEGEFNDIYDWGTTILGEEWGEHKYSYLIGDTDEITIFLTDIDGDDVDFKSSKSYGESVVVGYYHLLNVYKRDNSADEKLFSYSNERLMFTLDAPLLAYTGDKSSLGTPDEIKGIMYSSLAHEFQHMIHFYQKLIKKARILATYSETWLNELCSMALEDLLSDKIGVRGPRGVAPDDYTAGGAENEYGRLPNYNYAPELSLTDWNNYIYDYSLSYSFGALLIRNYGGAKLLRELVHSQYTDGYAITSAISKVTGKNIDMKTLMRDWGVAVLFSDKTGGDSYPGYNSGEAFSSKIEDYEYKLGSINYFNYSPTPHMYDSGIDPDDLTEFFSQHNRTSNNVYEVASSYKEGNIQVEVVKGSGASLTVINK